MYSQTNYVYTLIVFCILYIHLGKKFKKTNQKLVDLILIISLQTKSNLKCTSQLYEVVMYRTQYTIGTEGRKTITLCPMFILYIFFILYTVFCTATGVGFLISLYMCTVTIKAFYSKVKAVQKKNPCDYTHILCCYLSHKFEESSCDSNGATGLFGVSDRRQDSTL